MADDKCRICGASDWIYEKARDFVYELAGCDEFSISTATEAHNVETLIRQCIDEAAEKGRPQNG